MEEITEYRTSDKRNVSMRKPSDEQAKASDQVAAILAEVEKKFHNKNINYANYGHEYEDRLYNFREMAKRQFGSASPDNMIKALNVLVDKHLITIAKNGINDSEFRERVMDVIVYHVIALLIYEEAN